jgi:hypothetical protein
VNALATTGTNPLNALLAASVPHTSAGQTSSSFLNLVHLTFETPESEPAVTAAPASSQNIADALIRSMMASAPVTQSQAGPRATNATVAIAGTRATGAKPAATASNGLSSITWQGDAAVTEQNTAAQNAIGLAASIDSDDETAQTDAEAAGIANFTPAADSNLETSAASLKQSVSPDDLSSSLPNRSTISTASAKAIAFSRTFLSQPQTAATANETASAQSALPNNVQNDVAAQSPMLASFVNLLNSSARADATRSREASANAPSAVSRTDSTGSAAPLAFRARLTPIDQSIPPATPSTTQKAAGEEALFEPSLPSAADFSEQEPLAAQEQPVATNSSGVKQDDATAQTASNAPVKPHEPDRDAAVSVSAPAAVPAANDFNQTAQPAGAFAAPIDEKAPAREMIGQPATPVSDVGQTLRDSEPEISAPATTPSSPVQQIAVRISQGDGAPVDLHVTERGGEIQVSVRTADAAMQTSLRQDLGTLSSSLERVGYRAEMFTTRETPVAPVHEASMQTSTNLRDDHEQPNSGGRGGSGNPSNGRQQQQSPRNQSQKSWLEELENSK